MTEAVIVAAEYFGTALTVAEASAIVWTVAEVAFIVASVYTAREQQRKAQNRQREEYNNSLRDRYVMTRGATEPRQLVLGRQRVSGPSYFMQSYGSVREHLVFVVALAAHEIDAVEAIYFDDEQIILNGSGQVIGINRREYFSLAATGATFTIAGPAKAGTVSASVAYGSTTVALGVSVAGTAVTVSGGTAGQTGAVTISYQPDPCPYVPATPISATATVSLNGAGTGSVTLPFTPIAGTWAVIVPNNGTSDLDLIDANVTAFASLAGNVVTVTGVTLPSTGLPPANGIAVVQYSYLQSDYSRARVRTYLGAPGQAADAAMVAALPGVWTTAHTASGVAYLVVELDYDPDAFPTGIPNPSAVVRGAKVFDPRTGVTAWSENPALLMRHAALHPLCGRLSPSVVHDASIITAANVCDVATAYSVNGQTINRARYTAGTVVASGTRGQDVLNDLAQAMGGKWAFIDGQLRVLAGAYVTPLQTLDDTWLAGNAPVQVQPRPARGDVFNVATGKFVDEGGDYQVLALPRVSSAEYVAEDGAELPLDIQYNAVTFSAQGQQLQAQMIRDAREGLKLQLSCNYRADALEWGDTLAVHLPRFGLAGQTFTVLDTGYTIDGGISVLLKKTGPEIYALGATFAANPLAPNTFLPSPFTVPKVLGLAVDSSAAVQLRAADGTVAQRMRVSWSAITDPGVLAGGGGVEVRYGVASTPEAQWQSVFAESRQSSVDVPGIQPGQLYMLKARAYNTLVAGVWSAPVLHAAGQRSIVIDTPELAPEAATEYFETASAVQAFELATTFPSTTTWLYGSFTNTGSDDVRAEVSATAQLSVTAGSGTNSSMSVFASLGWATSLANLQGGILLGTDGSGREGPIAFGSSVVNSLTSVRLASFLIAPGQTIYFGFYPTFSTGGAGPHTGRGFQSQAQYLRSAFIKK